VRGNPSDRSERSKLNAFEEMEAHDAAADWVLADGMDAADFELDDDADAAARSPLRRNVRRGGVAERRLERVFRRHGYTLERQVPVVFLDPRGTPRAGSVDVVPVSRPGGRPAPAAFESKHIDLSRYRLPGGGLNAARLRTTVCQHVAQALNYQQGLAALNAMRGARGLPALPQRVRLIYQVPQATSRADAAQFQRLAGAVARPRGVAVTVFMPGSPASRAFEE